jgi:hypothetical protein
MFMKTGLTLLLVGAMHAGAETVTTDLETWLARAITNTTYQPPTQAEFRQAKELFGHTLNVDRSAAELKAGWEKLGFGFYEVATNGETLWLISEPQGKEFGRGWYLFRTQRQSSTAWEAPHAKNDIHTGVISLRLFLAGQSRAFAASTITRYQADMAHLDDTYFQAFTLAFAEACPKGLVIQLHGFESDNHTNAKADVIASAGTRSPESWFGDAIEDFRKATSLIVLAYPQDIKQLGATTNVQGLALHNVGRCRFLHLEFTKELRDRLTRDQKLRQAILESLTRDRK